ncbi:MAG: 30S ribosomal protein S4e [Methanomicrobia archaeon]|nr:30S ribosomal protein S4e [Methanomicrobia archaeon]
MEKHQKRIAAPRSWKIARKTSKWVVSSRPGPHPTDTSMPLLMIVRDMLQLADNSREAKRILRDGNVIVNGTVRKEHKFPVGVFDILSIPLIKAHYLVLLDKNDRLALVGIDEAAASKKLCRVNGKRMVKGGRTQLNCHDGRNFIMDEAGAEIHTHDSLLISIPDNKIMEHYRYKEGSQVVVIGGRHSAQTGEIEEIKRVHSPQPNVVRIKAGGNGESFESREDAIFVVGEQAIVVPGLSAL